MDIGSEDIHRLLVNNVNIYYYIVCVGLPKYSRIHNTDLTRWNRRKIGPSQPLHFQTIIMLNNMKAMLGLFGIVIQVKISYILNI